MDVNELITAIFSAVLALLGGCIAVVYSTLRSGMLRAHNRLDETDKMCSAYNARLSVLEETVKHLATAKDVSKIYERVNEVSGAVREIAGQQTVLIDLAREFISKKSPGG